MADDDEDGCFLPESEWNFHYELQGADSWENIMEQHLKWAEAKTLVGGGFTFERVWVSEDRVFIVSSGTLSGECGNGPWLRVYEKRMG